MTETGKRIKGLLYTEIKPSVLMFIDCLADWYKMAQTIYLQTEILEHDLSEQMEALEKFRGKLFILKEDTKTQLESDAENQRPPTAGDYTRSRVDVRELHTLSSNTRMLVQENDELILKLLSLI